MKLMKSDMALAFVIACGFARPCAADTIALKSSMRLGAAAQVVKLADIADLEGPDATALADLAIKPVADPAAVQEISIAEVRAKLDEAGVNWGRVNLNGRKVIVRPSRNAGAAPPMAMAPLSLDRGDAPKPATPQRSRDEQNAAELISSPLLRGVIANLIVSNLHLDSKNLRLSFDRTDHDVLDLPVQTTRVEVQPLSSFASDRIDLTIRTWSQGKVEQSRSISVLPLILVQAATLHHDVPKDQVLTDADLDGADQWLPPSQANQVSNRVAAVGRMAAKNLKAGEILRDKHVHRETLVKRGDQVTVRCLVGGTVISLQAEARADGSEGDVIELRKPGERDTFHATIAARGEAVMDLIRK